MGDLYDRAIELEERGMAICECGDEYVPGFFGDACGACRAREIDKTRPRCLCGRPAKFVADTVLECRVLERRPWCSEECAAICAAVDDPRASIDVVVQPGELGAVTSARACWCNLPAAAWCPTHQEIT